MVRASVGACALTLGLLPGCGDGEALAERDRQISELKQEIVRLSAKTGDAPAPAAPVAPPAPAAPFLDVAIVGAAGTAAGAHKFKLEADADGTLRELSLYHKDESALPPAVLALREQQYPGSKVRDYEIELDRAHGRVFEVEVTTRDGQDCEYSARPDGTLVYHECRIDPMALSEAVRAAVLKKVPGAEILEVEKKTHADGRVVHSVEVRADARVHELYFEGDALVRHELVFPAQLEVPAP